MNTNKISDWLRAPVLPVVVVQTEAQALAIAEGLIAGGIHQIEITLRTDAALAAIAAIAREYPDLALSAGSVLEPDQFDRAQQAGASLFISPGLTEKLANHAQKNDLAWVPGVATASEAMRACELGFHTLKFFPAMAAGGPKALAGISAPLATPSFIPTGGVTLSNLPEWKAIDSVVACGGTWLSASLDEFGATYAAISKGVAQRAEQALNRWHDQLSA
ncbi:MAG: bifunctional 4-hydroxy-2-oxoglutarate aldolase/2-dehydro-3-deoxy-phosphogluconate aldolase [Limnobacter sp.]|nr:bifunctional 4-hydroxy-2-oxoglutarate aldolase/2-dehydro-3-deoxy-phosphogluconate aldolase [Limnobacter sp.]